MEIQRDLPKTTQENIRRARSITDLLSQVSSVFITVFLALVP